MCAALSCSPNTILTKVCASKRKYCAIKHRNMLVRAEGCNRRRKSKGGQRRYREIHGYSMVHKEVHRNSTNTIQRKEDGVKTEGVAGRGRNRQW